MNKTNLLIFFILCALSTASFAQSDSGDTLVVLPTATIEEKGFQEGYSSNLIKDTDKNSSFSLAQVLERRGALYVRNYGINSLATVSIRGASARNTSLLWNGLSITNPMLGLNDLTLIPTFFIDSLSIENLGSSAFLGSNTMAGAISLFNDAEITEPQFCIGAKYGSFQNIHLDASLKFIINKVTFSFKPFYQSSQNNFEIRGSSSLNQNLNAALDNKGLLSEIGLHFHENHQLLIKNWTQEFNRQIPPTISSGISQASQGDFFTRTNVNWIYNLNRIKFRLISGYFNEKNTYQDPVIELENKNDFITLANKFHVDFLLSTKQQIKIGIENERVEARSGFYSSPITQSTWSVISVYKYYNDKINASISVRQDLLDGTIIPIRASFFLDYKLMNRVDLYGSVSKVHSIPGINDRFWIPGGNPDLKAENGWNSEMGIKGRFSHKNISFRFENTLFLRRLDNLIQWKPGAIFWSVENIAVNNAYGIENQLDVSYKLNKTFFKMQWQFDVNRSLDKNQNQLIYNPQLTGATNVSLERDNWALEYTQTYASKSYILSDNSDWLDPYTLSHINLSYKWQFEELKIENFINVYNLFDVEYQVVKSRPMPGIHFDLGARFTFK